MKSHIMAIGEIITECKNRKKEVSIESLDKFVERLGDRIHEYRLNMIVELFEVYIYDERLFEAMIKNIDYSDDSETIYNIMTIIISNTEIKKNVKPDDYNNAVKFLKNIIKGKKISEITHITYSHDLYDIFKLFNDHGMDFNIIRSCGSKVFNKKDEVLSIYSQVYDMIMKDVEVSMIKYWVELALKSAIEEIDTVNGIKKGDKK